MSLPRLQSIIEATPGSCYAISWQKDGETLKQNLHYNPPWRVEAMKDKGLYTIASANYSFQPDEGFVGKVFSTQKPVFVQDLQALSEEAISASFFEGTVAFQRVALAKEFGIHSAVFIPVPNGVIEVGSCRKSEAQFMSDEIMAAITRGEDLPAMASGDEHTASGKTWQTASGLSLERLKGLVKLSGAASYGIEWAASSIGTLTCKGHWNPQWRIDEARAKGLHDLYTTASASWSFQSGEGFVGKVFGTQTPLFVPDLQSLSREDIASSLFGCPAPFQRVALASRFDIHSAIFIPLPDGVIELGSCQILANSEDLLPEASIVAVK